MKIRDLGQFGLIDAVAKLIEKSRNPKTESWNNLLAGIGDDCAVWKWDGSNQLGKVDCQVQGVHFNLDIISWKDLGWKALAANLSDIAASGGLPSYALVSLGLPPDTEVEDVLSFYKGLLELADLSGTAVVGGNMSGSPVVFADISVIGKTGNPSGSYLSRSSAKPGNLIAVTGYLGTSAAGLEMLTHKLAFEKQIEQTLKQGFVRPQPRLAEGLVLVAKDVKNGMDISDGLLADLGHICQASQVGGIVEIELLPIRSEVKSAFGDRSFQMALSGGEDYELLFTADRKVIDEVKKAAACPVTVIGEVVADNPGQTILIDREGKRTFPTKTGWDHFKHFE